VLNKMDEPQVRERWPTLKAALKADGHAAMAISALARQGTRDLLQRAAKMLAELPEERPTPKELPVFRLEDDEESFVVEWDEDGWRVRGARVERMAAMTVWNLDEAVRRFQRTLYRMGVSEALEQAGVQPGDTVRIGETEFEWEE
jgi:GTP-binding protein